MLTSLRIYFEKTNTCPQMPSELAQQQTHEIAQHSFKIPPCAGTMHSAWMGPIILWQVCKSKVHTTRRPPTQS